MPAASSLGEGPATLSLGALRGRQGHASKRQSPDYVYYQADGRARHDGKVAAFGRGSESSSGAAITRCGPIDAEVVYAMPVG